MKAIRSLKASTEKYLRNSIRAYFEGEPGCDLRWIIGYRSRSLREEKKLSQGTLNSEQDCFAATFPA